MKPLEIEDFEKYLTHLRALPFVRKVEIRAVQPAKGPYRPDAALRLRTPRGTHDLLVEVKRTHLTYVLVDGILARIGKMAERPWILFAPYVGRRMGRHLAEFGVNYVDTAGNCRLRIGDDYCAIIEGQRPAREARQGRGIGVPGYQVLFAILAKPDLLNTPIRTLADAEVRAFFDQNAAQIIAGTPEAFAQQMREDTKITAELVKKLGIKPE